MKNRFSKFAYILGAICVIWGAICIIQSSEDKKLYMQCMFCGICMIIVGKLSKKKTGDDK